ncbi:Golgi transport complex subunit 4, partial [Dinochytrium kinnereticum]
MLATTPQTPTPTTTTTTPAANPPPQPPQDHSLPLEKLRHLIDISEIQTQLRILNDEENRVDMELDQILKGQEEVEVRLDSLDGLRPEIDGLIEKSGNLYEVVERTSVLAESISRKVRQLDLEQSRVRAAYTLAQEIQDLKDCALGVQQAIKDSDYETAGHHIHRFLQFDHATLDRIFTSPSAIAALSSTPHLLLDPSTDQMTDAALLLGEAEAEDNTKARNPLTVLRSAQKMVMEVVVEEFDASVRVGDEGRMVRFLKVFPLIGRGRVGLDRHSGYVCGIVSRMCQDWMKEVDER